MIQWIHRYDNILATQIDKLSHAFVFSVSIVYVARAGSWKPGAGRRGRRDNTEEQCIMSDR